MSTTNIKRRLNYIEKQLQLGRNPVLRKHLPGAVELCESYGKEPPFIPRLGGL